MQVSVGCEDEGAGLVVYRQGGWWRGVGDVGAVGGREGDFEDAGAWEGVLPD